METSNPQDQADNVIHAPWKNWSTLQSTGNDEVDLLDRTLTEYMRMFLQKMSKTNQKLFHLAQVSSLNALSGPPAPYLILVKEIFNLQLQ